MKVQFKVIGKEESIPDGYRLLTLPEALLYLKDIKLIVKDPDGVSFETGFIKYSNTKTIMQRSSHVISKEDNSHCQRRLVGKGIQQVTKPYQLLIRDYNEGILADYRVMTFEEVQQCIHEIQPLLPPYGTVAFYQGTIKLDEKKQAIMGHQIQLLDKSYTDKQILIKGDINVQSQIIQFSQSVTYSINRLDEEIPDGYRWMNFYEAKQCLSKIRSFLPENTYLAHQTGFVSKEVLEKYRQYLIIKSDWQKCFKLYENEDFKYIKDLNKMPNGFHLIKGHEFERVYKKVLKSIPPYTSAIYDKGIIRRIIQSYYVKVDPCTHRILVKGEIQMPDNFIIKPQIDLQELKLQKIGINQEIPNGFRELNYSEALSCLEQIKPMISKWESVALGQGKISGAGYGYNLDQDHRGECDFRIIVSEDAKIQNSQVLPQRPRLSLQLVSQQATLPLPQISQRVGLSLPLISKPARLPLISPSSYKISLKIVSYGTSIYDYFWMTCDEANLYLQQIIPILNPFSCIALQDGKIYGQKFGYSIVQSDQTGCTEILLIKGSSYPKSFVRHNRLLVPFDRSNSENNLRTHIRLFQQRQKEQYEGSQS